MYTWLFTRISHLMLFLAKKSQGMGRLVKAEMDRLGINYAQALILQCTVSVSEIPVARNLPSLPRCNQVLKLYLD